MKKMIYILLVMLITTACGTESSGQKDAGNSDNQQEVNENKETERMVGFYKGITGEGSFEVDSQGSIVHIQYDTTKLEEFKVGDLLDVTYYKDGDKIIATEVIGNTGAL